MKSILVITGMSGSGKTTAIRALEDAGWFCIDNLPAPLLLKVTELGESKDQLAFVVDVREGQFLKDAPRVIEEARRAGHKVEVLFLDSSDEALTRRYSETRRRHPLAGSGGVAEGIAKEREALEALREHAEHVLDTSTLTVHELRRQVMARFGHTSQGLSLTIMSFGFKYGVPSNADLVFDVRFLPTPSSCPSSRRSPARTPTSRPSSSTGPTRGSSWTRPSSCWSSWCPATSRRARATSPWPSAAPEANIVQWPSRRR